ncbi:MAG: hypothetical protein A2Y17_10290 [Clostridiales bacterium GWF2_38_85]|nr:MAG: hypothetical protein A2Y17_10290 [Clostridiales bacterium GWF2_38_85]HBL84871.1 hypothetical protein [Clostridiales bacterium]
MQSLNEKTWEKFDVFGEAGFLRIASTNSSIDSIRLKEGKEKTVPYITRSDAGNGITRFVSKDNYEDGSNDAGCITVGLDTQTAFYQPHKFVTGQNIQVVTGDLLNEDSAHFYVTILKNQMEAKFNWGGNGATLGRMKRLEAMLPTTASGKPDYDYMADFMRQKRKVMQTKYSVYVEKRIDDLGTAVDIPALNEKEWKPVSITAVFKLVRGREGNMAMLKDGDIPLISAKNANNGLKGFVNTPKKTITGHCITLNNDGDGGAGLAYYQPADMALDTHVTALIPNDTMSEWSMIFIAKCVSELHGFFGHGLSISNKRAEKIKIMLPVNDAGKPDFGYMEQYVKNMLLKKYKQYAAFLDAKKDMAQA